MATTDTNNKTFTTDEVSKLVESIFAKFAPIIESVALSPEKLREANKPYIDPIKLAQENHQRKENQRAEADRLKGQLAMQRQCRHKDEKGNYRLGLQHNFPDGQPRGVCPICLIVIEPAHWDWRPVTKADGTIVNEAFTVPADPLYFIVQNLEAYGKSYTGNAE